jgi:hypothetical protein
VFDIDRYSHHVGRLQTDDLAFDAFPDQPLPPAALRCLRYMHDVEAHTSCYLRNLLNTKAHHDPSVTKFLTLWAYEELWHGEAIAEVLAAHDEPAGDVRIAAMRRRLGWRITASPLVWMGLSSVTRHFLAVHMTFGVINEWTTQAGYSRLIQVADHPVLTDLLRRIMKQEGRHIDYYLTQSRSLLAASPRAQRVTRQMLQRLWEPVGAQVMPKAETRHLVGTLFGGEDGRSVAERVDRRIDALPGLAGLGLMAGARSKYG